MALSKSALSDLLDALRAGGDLDVIREGLALVLQALIDAEAAQHIGARPYERSQQRIAHRNGTWARLLSTLAITLTRLGDLPAPATDDRATQATFGANNPSQVSFWAARMLSTSATNWARVAASGSGGRRSISRSSRSAVVA
jgi:hypothetical protein